MVDCGPVGPLPDDYDPPPALLDPPTRDPAGRIHRARVDLAVLGGIGVLIGLSGVDVWGGYGALAWVAAALAIGAVLLARAHRGYRRERG